MNTGGFRKSKKFITLRSIPASDRKKSKSPPLPLGAAKISSVVIRGKVGYAAVRFAVGDRVPPVSLRARRNDKGCEAAIATFYVSTFVDSGVWLILLTWFESGVII